MNTKRDLNLDHPSAESVEGSEPAEGNAHQAGTSRTQRRKRASLGLVGVRRVAERDKDVRFTALLHHVTVDLLRDCYLRQRKQASPGVDGQTWAAYGEQLEARLTDLHARIQRGSYRPPPARRVWIAKADGSQRPLGLPTVEDKIVQTALKRVLEAVYEADFLGFSYGFRPGRSQHDALDAVWVGLSKRKVNWVLDADIRGFFDAIDHDWLMKFIEHRIADRRVVGLIQRWLKAGVLDDGQWTQGEAGTPQGSGISPLLANVFLHYALDQWVEQWRTRHAHGDVVVVRYADDFVVGFQHRGEAVRFRQALDARLGKFGLTLHPQKTRLIEFGRFAARDRKRRGQGKPETFDFLGFTHISGVNRHGWFTIKRVSMAKRMRAKLQQIKQQLRRMMHRPIREQARWLARVVRGWFQYHAVPGNRACLWTFRQQVRRDWLHVVRRRSQKGRQAWNWERFARIADAWLPMPKILHPYPTQRLIVTTRGRSRMR